MSQLIYSLTRSLFSLKTTLCSRSQADLLFMKILVSLARIALPRIFRSVIFQEEIIQNQVCTPATAKNILLQQRNKAHVFRALNTNHTIGSMLN